MKKHEKIFRRNKLKDLAILIISLFFVFAGFSVLEKSSLMGWMGTLFFGFLAVIFFIQLIANIAYLKLHDQGFSEKTILKTKSFKWRHVSNFEIRSFRLNKRIYFDHVD